MEMIWTFLAYCFQARKLSSQTVFGKKLAQIKEKKVKTSCIGYMDVGDRSLRDEITRGEQNQGREIMHGHTLSNWKEKKNRHAQKLTHYNTTAANSPLTHTCAHIYAHACTQRRIHLILFCLISCNEVGDNGVD